MLKPSRQPSSYTLEPSPSFEPRAPLDAAPASTSSGAAAETRTAGGRDSPASVLGPDLRIRGGIEGRGEIHLQGRAWGDVKVERLLVGESAELEGSVLANAVEVRGRVLGAIEAHMVRLHPSAVVEGDITYEQIHIEIGAQFEGRCIRAKKAPVAAALAEEVAVGGQDAHVAAEYQVQSV